MGLADVEALGDLLESETELQLDFNQFRLSVTDLWKSSNLIIQTNWTKCVEDWISRLKESIAKIEAQIEFGQTDFIRQDQDFARHLKSMYREFDDCFQRSKHIFPRMKAGYEFIIFGPPNSGKSSLLNRLGKIDCLRHYSDAF